MVGGATYTPQGSATSKLTVAITVDSSASAVCSISSAGVVSFQTAGTCFLDANQAGNVDYNAATQVQQSFVVSQLPVFVLICRQPPPRWDRPTPTCSALTGSITDLRLETGPPQPAVHQLDHGCGDGDPAVRHQDLQLFGDRLELRRQGHRGSLQGQGQHVAPASDAKRHSRVDETSFENGCTRIVG